MSIFISSLFIKDIVKHSYGIRKINDDLRGLFLLQNFHFCKAFMPINYLCGDGVHLTETVTELFEGNIVIVLNNVALNVNMDGFLDLHNRAHSEEKEKKNSRVKKMFSPNTNINQANISDLIKKSSNRLFKCSNSKHNI